MTSGRNRSQQYWERVEPFILQDWSDRGLEAWQQFRNWATQQILSEFGPSIPDIEDATEIDGAHDQGIDAWYYDDSDTPPKLILVQSKHTRPKREDLSKIRDGFLDIMLPERPGTPNAALREKAAILRGNMPERLKIDIYLATSEIAPQNLTPKVEGDPLYPEQLQIGNTLVEAEYYVRDIRYLSDNISLSNTEPIDGSFPLEGGAAFEFTAGGHTRTICAALDANTLANLYQVNKENLFRKNPRFYMPGTKWNKDIKLALAEDQNEDFFIYNNGLTCVAQAVRITGSNQLEIKDFQIVNGCQTVASIWAARRDGADVSKVRVLAKIVENSRTGAENDRVSSLIAERSNRQNVIKAQDWKANDRRQEVWQDGLRRLPEPWFYEIKRGLWANADTNVKAVFRIEGTRQFRKMTLMDLGQTCQAFIGDPAAAQDRPRYIFERDETYGQVFEEGLAPYQLLLPHLIFLGADRKTREQREFELDREFSIQTSHARFTIVATVGRMLRDLAGAAQGYLDASLAESLAKSQDAWLSTFVDLAFDEVAYALAQRAKEAGTGPKSIIRRNDWWSHAADNATRMIRQQIAMEKRLGLPEGSVAAALPFDID